MWLAVIGVLASIALLATGNALDAAKATDLGLHRALFYSEHESRLETFRPFALPDAGWAAEAVALFCYQAKKWIGSFTAALGGLETLVFAGGIGEKAPLIRTRICEGLGFLGIELNEARNAENASLISTDGGRVAVRVIRTDEELMIARSVSRVLEFASVT